MFYIRIQLQWSVTNLYGVYRGLSWLKASNIHKKFVHALAEKVRFCYSLLVFSKICIVEKLFKEFLLIKAYRVNLRNEKYNVLVSSNHKVFANLFFYDERNTMMNYNRSDLWRRHYNSFEKYRTNKVFKSPGFYCEEYI